MHEEYFYLDYPWSREKKVIFNIIYMKYFHLCLIDIDNEQIQIFVEDHATKNKITLNLNANTTIKYVKAEIHEKMNIPPEEQHLVLAKKQLMDEQRLIDYKIKADTTIHLRPKLRGG